MENEIKNIIKKLEDIFPTVNEISAESATTLMSAIKELEQLPTERQVTLHTVIKAIEDDPDLLANVLKEVGPHVLLQTLMNVKTMAEEIANIRSSGPPSLDAYPLGILKELERKLERNKDNPENRFILDGLRSHLRRRERRNPDEFS